MKEDFSELVEYLDEKFSNVDQKFGKVAEDIGDIREDIRDVRERMATKESMDTLIGAVDAYAHKADKYFQEMAALTAKVDRLEKWITEIADKVGIELKS